MFQEHTLHSYPFINEGPKNKKFKVKHNKEIKVPQGVLHIKPTWKPVTLDEKPPFSYATIIAHAILSSPERKLTLSEIYQWISEQYPCYSIKDHRWQNSIRHNLSLQKAFVKLDRDSNTPTSGKGCYWTILPGYEQQFIDNLMKHDKSITHCSKKPSNQKKRSSHLFTIFRMTTKPEKETPPPPPPPPQDDDSDCDSGIDLDCATTTTTKITPPQTYVFPQQQDDMLLFNTYMDQSLYLMNQEPLTPLPTYEQYPTLDYSLEPSFIDQPTLDHTPSLDPSSLVDSLDQPTLAHPSSLDPSSLHPTLGYPSFDSYYPFNYY